MTIVRALLAGLLFSACSAAMAATCSVNSPTLSFGAYTGAQINSSGTISVTCTRALFEFVTINYTVALSTGGSGSYAQRRLTRIAPPADTLNYNLYRNTVPPTLNTSVWGNGSGGTAVASGTITFPFFVFSVTRNHVVAGAIPTIGALPTAGSYTDTVIITLTY